MRRLHFRKVTYSEERHIGEKDGGLDDLRKRGSGLLENGLEVLAALSSLLANGTLDLSVTILRVKRDRARAVDGVGCLDGLGLFDIVSFLNMFICIRVQVRPT